MTDQKAFVVAMMEFADIADELTSTHAKLVGIEQAFQTLEYQRIMVRLNHALGAVKFIESNTATAAAIVGKLNKGDKLGAHAGTVKAATQAVNVGKFALSAMCHEAQMFHARTLNPAFTENGLGSMLGAALSLYSQFSSRSH